MRKFTKGANRLMTEVFNREPGTIHIVMVALFAGIQTLLGFFGNIGFTIQPGVSVLYPVVAVQVLGGIWFGIWGVIASMIGPTIANIAAGYPVVLVLTYAPAANAIRTIVPMWAFRQFNGDPRLRDAKSWILLLVFGMLINNMIGGVIGNVTFYDWGYFVSIEDMIYVGYFWWVANNALVVAVYGVPILLAMSAAVMRTRAYCVGYLA